MEVNDQPDEAPQDARAAQGAATANSLRRQARKLFTKKGYSGANTEELVGSARVTKAPSTTTSPTRRSCTTQW